MLSDDVTDAARRGFHVAELINFNKAKKAKGRADGKARAAENRVRFGQAKGDKAAAKLEAERARRELEGKKRDT